VVVCFFLGYLRRYFIEALTTDPGYVFALVQTFSWTCNSVRSPMGFFVWQSFDQTLVDPFVFLFGFCAGYIFFPLLFFYFFVVKSSCIFLLLFVWDFGFMCICFFFFMSFFLVYSD